MTTRTEETGPSGAAYNAFLAVCPSRMLLDRLANKWVVLVLCALGGDAEKAPDVPAAPTALRYSELARLLSGVSQKMLTQTLRSLERDGLLTRTVVPTVPVTVTYELTDLGLSLLGVVRRLREWAQSHMDDVLAHREKYDARA
ncbi:winged helix-turn-helix transcriptional regulator [Thermobifida cellulosilytica]|uniref:HxlR family transcriptional regulator n=1 Tax=Thermobifida cellulosilytica TB100 TaxID=665004 RepID=A0A147KK96_THECS|nr:helix-turn-helix domain-containing protein [Thermobifida cellulosilytica]KUP97716.1 HxlR family transcriptional regulator [Thermobifida cellulosilytica TB100]